MSQNNQRPASAASASAQTDGQPVALVTGGSRGIGRAICLELAARGYHVAVNYGSNVQAARQTVAACEAAGAVHGTRAVALAADVADHDAAKQLVTQTIERFGKLDVLVNNAGIIRDGLMIKMSPDDFEAVVRVNMQGTFNCMKHAGRIMARARAGSIVNVSSIVGIRGNAGQVNYAASKAGVIAMTKSAARELGGRGVRVNAVAPGYIETDMTAALGADARQQFTEQIVLGRLGTPEDVAKVVAFLAGPDAGYITGQVITVDGGISI